MRGAPEAVSTDAADAQPMTVEVGDLDVRGRSAVLVSPAQQLRTFQHRVCAGRHHGKHACPPLRRLVIERMMLPDT